MFTNSTFSNPNWLQQKDHESSIVPRPVIVRFSLTSRSVLVRSSFVSRSSLVAYSLVYRRPTEDRTRNKQKTNERATNVDRDADEKLSATRRFVSVMAGRMPFCNHKPAYCHSPCSCEADSSTFGPIQDILTSNQVFSTHSAHSIPHPQQKPLTGSKNTSPLHRPTTTKDTSYLS